jgi:hypothetical protein
MLFSNVLRRLKCIHAFEGKDDELFRNMLKEATTTSGTCPQGLGSSTPRRSPKDAHGQATDAVTTSSGA